MRHTALPLVFAALAWLAIAPGAARADSLPNVYVGIVGGYTGTLDLPDGAAEPMGPAIGARAGLTLPTTDVYVGGLFLFHTGESVSIGSMGAEVSSSSFMLGGEAGYELSLGPLVLRPSLGLGLHQVSLDVSGPAAVMADEDSGAFYLSPGVNAMISLGVLLGAELRYNAILADDHKDSISALATLGLSF
ncbi:MAG: outer membrane beta-barrel protein [Myxococcales bacterium]|jgi:hypothetical protein